MEPELMKDPSQSIWKGQTEGYLVFDSQFNPAPEVNQKRMMELCDKFEDHEDFIDIVCPLRDFKDWLNEYSPDRPWPIAEEDFYKYW